MIIKGKIFIENKFLLVICNIFGDIVSPGSIENY